MNSDAVFAELPRPKRQLDQIDLTVMVTRVYFILITLNVGLSVTSLFLAPSLISLMVSVDVKHHVYFTVSSALMSSLP